MENELREIRTQLRLAMNGVVSTSMREKGIKYKLNFGVPLLEIREIARQHTPNAALAAALWKEDIREFKILATFLEPPSACSLEQAQQWVREIPYLEIAEQASRNLFSKLPQAEILMERLWTNTEDEYARTVAFLIAVQRLADKHRLGLERETGISDIPLSQSNDVYADSLASSLSEKRKGSDDSPETGMSGGIARRDFIDECIWSLGNASVAWKEKQAALSALKFYGRQSSSDADEILSRLSEWSVSDDPELQEFYNDLKFEFEYYR